MKNIPIGKTEPPLHGLNFSKNLNRLQKRPYQMDRAHGRFSATFIGIGDKGQEIGQYVNKEFDELIKYFQKYREDGHPDFCEGNELPQLTVISPNDSPHESIKKLPEQEVIFLLGSQNDQAFLETRNKHR